METDAIYSINGPVITVRNTSTFSLMEMVYVGKNRLLGEVVSMSKDTTTIQVYESTDGLKPGEPVTSTGKSMSIELGPGILRNIFDGIGRPLKAIKEQSGAFITPGSDVETFDEDKTWTVRMKVQREDTVKHGDIFATIDETSIIEHRLMVPRGLEGTIVDVVDDGDYTCKDTLIKIKGEDGNIHPLTMVQRWPIKTPRPVSKRLDLSMPLVTGQRVIDTLFPITKGGAAAIPGGFGSGKTMTQHQLAKWCDADIIVFVGCGERGNEMTQALDEFSELTDPKSGKPLTDRTVLIANTSNMPVAAREASIYTGITIAEYYRDMGYHVAMLADSTSRWAEALREISGRLEEMPAEEGFPPYLSSRLSKFYERAGYYETLNNQNGSITIVGAVSPQGADFSEPVTQNTKRFIHSFWALDKQLAYERHYPAINWNQSYSEYIEPLKDWYMKHVDEDFIDHRQKIVSLLNEENKLQEIVKLIGSSLLPDDQKLVLEISSVIRKGFLQQNAFHDFDSYVTLEKQMKMMDVILYLYDEAKVLIDRGIAFRMLTQTDIFNNMNKMKYDIPNDDLDQFDKYYDMIDNALADIE
ncbi:MAG: V-type ATP synthase subunit A [Candidatus Izemoplasmataceae bacterium]